jgi:hypothetical protein
VIEEETGIINNIQRFEFFVKKYPAPPGTFLNSSTNCCFRTGKIQEAILFSKEMILTESVAK